MENYNELIKSKPVVMVEFFATWCPHCQRMAPVVEQLKELAGPDMAVYQFDIDKYPQLAEAHGADTIPTFIVYKNGGEVWRHTGEISGNDLLNHLK